MIFNENKYYKCYYSIINRAKSRDLLGYKEQHHIVPRSMGGSDLPENLVFLTAKEHYIVHLLLPYFVIDPKHRKKMWHALRCMSIMVSPTTCNRYTGSARFYQKAKENTDHAHMKGKKHSLETKKRMSENRMGHPVSDDTKKKIGLANAKNTGRAPWNKGLATGSLSKEHREKISTGLAGRKKSEETKANMKAAQALRTKDSYAAPGWKHSDDALAKIRQYAQNRPRIVCPHCGLEGAIPGMKRYHFDNCKSRSDASNN